MHRCCSTSASWLFLCALGSAAFLLTSCTSTPKEKAPFTADSVLVYEVRDDDETYEMRLSFSPQSYGYNITMQTPAASRTVKTDFVTAPQNATESQMESSGTGLLIDYLYLPEGSRKVGAIIPGGRITEKSRFGEWSGYRVMTVAPAGFKFYEEENGLLVGWSFQIGRNGVAARLKSQL